MKHSLKHWDLKNQNVHNNLPLYQAQVRYLRLKDLEQALKQKLNKVQKTVHWKKQKKTKICFLKWKSTKREKYHLMIWAVQKKTPSFHAGLQNKG